MLYYNCCNIIISISQAPIKTSDDVGEATLQDKEEETKPKRTKRVSIDPAAKKGDGDGEDDEDEAHDEKEAEEEGDDDDDLESDEEIMKNPVMASRGKKAPDDKKTRKLDKRTREGGAKKQGKRDKVVNLYHVWLRKVNTLFLILNNSLIL